MASYTTNLNLKKPAGSENVAIGDINGNMDTIDTAYGSLRKQLLSDWFTPHETNITLDTNNSWAYKCGDIVYIQLFFTNNSSGTISIGTLSSNCKPVKPIYTKAINNSTENEVIEVAILNSGAVTGYSSVNGKQYIISHMYIV